VLRYGDRPISQGFVALVPPAGLVFVPALSGGAGALELVVFEPAGLLPSDLVGPPPTAPSGRVWGRLPVGDLRFDDAMLPTALDAACLASLVEPLDPARASG